MEAVDEEAGEGNDGYMLVAVVVVDVVVGGALSSNSIGVVSRHRELGDAVEGEEHEAGAAENDEEKGDEDEVEVADDEKVEGGAAKDSDEDEDEA